MTVSYLFKPFRMKTRLNTQLVAFVITFNILTVLSSVFLEKLSTKCYKGVLFQNHAFLTCLESLICTLFCALFKSKNVKVMKSNFAHISILDFLSNQLSRTALGYINYQTLMVCKTARFIPILALNFLVYKRKIQYKNFTPAILTSIGVVSFILFGADESANKNEYAYGIFLLGLNALIGAYSSEAKKNINKDKSIGVIDTMYYFHTFTFYIYFIYLTIFTSEFRQTIAFLKVHGDTKTDISCYLIFHFLSALMFFTMLKRCESGVIRNVGIIKNIVKIIVSLMWFKRDLNYMQWISILTIILSYIFDYIERNDTKKSV